MTAAPTLTAAAGRAFDDLQSRYVANQLKVTLDLFWRDIIETFPESEPASHPVSNWITVIAALAMAMPPPPLTPLTQLTSAAEAVYRLCWMTNFLRTTGAITATQGNLVLAAYNAIIVI